MRTTPASRPARPQSPRKLTTRDPGCRSRWPPAPRAEGPKLATRALPARRRPASPRPRSRRPPRPASGEALETVDDLAATPPAGKATVTRLGTVGEAQIHPAYG